MRQTGTGRARRRSSALGPAAVGVAGWAVYRVASTRMVRAPTRGDDGCRTDPSTAADMGRFDPGAAPIRCQAWDIGTGVIGFAWHAPAPRAVLLLQHGYAEYAQRFVGQYNRLISHLLHIGVSVYAIDLRGHGRSPGRRGLVDVGRAIEDHLAARRRLRDQPLPVFALGHSLGGLVTAGSVVRDPSGMRGVVLSSPALLFETTAALRAFAIGAAFVAPTVPAPLRASSTGPLYRGAEEDERLASAPLHYRGRLQMLVAATVATVSHGNWKRYPAWNVPVLAMHGTADRITDPLGSRRFIDAVAAEDKSLHLVEGGYHELLNDTERDETLRVLLAWLERRLPPNGG